MDNIANEKERWNGVISIDKSDPMFDAVRWVLTAVSKDITRHQMMGVYAEVDGQWTNLIATDGHRVHILRYDDASVMFPHETIMEVITNTQKQIVFSGGIDGIYPNYRRVIPDTGKALKISILQKSDITDIAYLAMAHGVKINCKFLEPLVGRAWEGYLTAPGKAAVFTSFSRRTAPKAVIMPQHHEADKDAADEAERIFALAKAAAGAPVTIDDPPPAAEALDVMDDAPAVIDTTENADIIDGYRSIVGEAPDGSAVTILSYRHVDEDTPEAEPPDVDGQPQDEPPAKKWREIQAIPKDERREYARAKKAERKAAMEAKIEAALADGIATGGMSIDEACKRINAKGPAANYQSPHNYLIVAYHQTIDARTFKAWQKAGRKVRKGAKAFFIDQPHVVGWHLVTDDAGETVRQPTVVSVPCPVFAYEDTDGEPVDYEPMGETGLWAINALRQQVEMMGAIFAA